ncbi:MULTISPECIES: DsbA family protein [Rahnella]|uniref:DsbA family protein n=1 Tax=Rahnella laticis TaxID=2787622 RepID=A0ABS0E128_9GAMM|nr:MULTISPECIES: DsbA family protein [Rahnella]MBF7978804.1 DsbA family protein [Rahnella laticis]MBF7998894.1 DsbA family protein [Rahnella sp. LAC-M12]
MKTLMLIMMMVISPVVLAMTPEDTLFNNPASPWFGAKNPRLTIVSFTDYNCPYCKQFDPMLEKVAKENPDIKVVIKLLPFRGASSIIAGRAAMTVWEQHPEKFLVVHQRLMSKKGQHDEASALEALKYAGLEPIRVTPASYLELKTNVEIAEVLGIQGTPATIIGDQLIAGAISWEDLQKVVKEQLAKAKHDQA